MAVAPNSFFRNVTSLNIFWFPVLGWAHRNLESATVRHLSAMSGHPAAALPRHFHISPLIISNGTSCPLSCGEDWNRE